MKVAFVKDILIIDFEATHKDLQISQPIQLGAVLLDRVTLEEKDTFTTFLKADLNQYGISEKHKAHFGPHMEAAPTQAEVGRRFVDQFGREVMFGSWVANLDMTMLRKIIEAAGMNWTEFDYHIFDIWPVAYIELLKSGYTGSIRSEEMFQRFGLPSRGIHDALEDCRHAAAVLRKLAA